MGQVQSRETEAHFFKLTETERNELTKKYTELASASRGGKVLSSTDEFFGEAFHLIQHGPAIEDKNRESSHGFWKDGWETRRHNKDTHHSAIIQLACPATIAGFDIDTSFFDGSHPVSASIEGCLVREEEKGKYQWQELLPKVPLNGNSHQFYGLKQSETVVTHIRLNMYPDGGIARLRVYGSVAPILPHFTTLELSSFSNGGRVIKSSNDRYGNPSNILLPFVGVNTRDGWQTRRSRVESHHDWVEIKLGVPGLLESVSIDTTHFRGNNPEYASLDACTSEYNDVRFDPDVKWVNILKRSELTADVNNLFKLETDGEAFTHVRLNIYPDGGISRLRVFGTRSDISKVEKTEVEGSTNVVNGLSITESVVLKERSRDSFALTSEVSSVSTLVAGEDEEEEEEEEEDESIKTGVKRGRPKPASTSVGIKKKTKGRPFDEVVEEVPVVSPPRNKRARE
ncbi:Allantoicase [Lunasporangiospora selenospora]|uniref:Allantoicase n=1 Tax=Lunasporangiospora selenospora TaxID=979761 RepID=A0A9P6FX57_9FUNG|nr:Allantoicase [Lunasporangiospora selenospora]